MGRPGEKPWNFHTCKLCTYRSKSTFLMYKHGRFHRKKSKNGGKDFFICHWKAPEMFECQLCGFDTGLKVNLKEHLSVVHEEKQVNEKIESILEYYRCKDCVFETYSVLVLAKHVDDHHSDANLQQNDLSSKIETNDSNNLDVESRENFESSDNEIVTQLCEVTSSSDIFPNIKIIKSANEVLESVGDTIEPCKLALCDGQLGFNSGDEELVKEIINKKLHVVLTRIDPLESSSMPKKKYGPKKNCCFFCKQLFVKIPIHFENRHSDQEEVKNLMSLPKGCSERKKIIEKLRRLGNFEYNNSKDCTEIITCRRLRMGKTNTNYVPCPRCKGYFSKCALRKHFRKCANKQDRKKNILISSKRLEYNHLEEVCLRLKTNILPVLRSEQVAETIINDPFLIEYANNLCSKYAVSLSFDGVIRTILRTLVKFYLEMRETNSKIEYFEQIFNSVYFKDINTVVDKIGKKDPRSGVYKVPTTALNLGIWFRQSVQFYIMRCIQNRKFEECSKAEILLGLLRGMLASVNSSVVQSKKVVYINMKMGNKLTNTNVFNSSQECAMEK